MLSKDDFLELDEATLDDIRTTAAYNTACTKEPPPGFDCATCRWFTNNGGLGVIGGVGYTPKFLREQIQEIKSKLDDPNAPFGVDLLTRRTRWCPHSSLWASMRCSARLRRACASPPRTISATIW